MPGDDSTSDPVPADPRAAPALVSWHLVGSSRELLDATYCSGNFPSPWQTSLAVFAAAAPATSCERIVWLKVAVTLTGIQVDEHAQALFDHLPPESAALDTLDQYLGCYGAMLRVGVYARHRPPRHGAPNEASDPTRIPRIIDCQPRNRDLYQAATVEGEVLTGSSTDLKIDHSHKTTSSQELDAEVKGGWGSGDSGSGGGQSGGGGGGSGSAGPNLSASLTTKFNWSDERVDSTGVGVGSTGQTRTATTTTISQLYSLLESYHLGSNVMSFLLLPRPHVLPSTSLRTFVPGLRALDGIQEFFLVVAAPPDSQGLRIEARVDTGHFSTTDGASAAPPPVVTIPTVFSNTPVDLEDEIVGQWTNSSDHFDIQVQVFPTGWQGGGEPTRNSFIYVLDAPPPSAGLGDLIIDTTRGDPGHPGISLINDRSPSATHDRLQNNLYLAISETEVRIEIDVTTAMLQGLPDINMTYRVYTRPRTSDDSQRTDVVVVARGLCVEFEDFDANGCLQGAITHDSPPLEYSDRAVPHASSGGGSGASASGASGGMNRTVGSSSSGGGGPLGGMTGSYGLALDLLQGMKRCLAGTQRNQAGRDAAQSLVDSDFVVRQLTSNLDPHVGGRRISTLKVKNTPAGLRARTVAQVLSEPAAALARVTSQPESRIRAFRRQILTHVLAIDPPTERQRWRHPGESGQKGEGSA